MPIEILSRYARVDRLLRRRSTGNRDELAKKLGVSVRTLYRIKEDLEYFGAQIGYDSVLQSYFYIKPPRGLFEKE